MTCLHLYTFQFIYTSVFSMQLFPCSTTLIIYVFFIARLLWFDWPSGHRVYIIYKQHRIYTCVSYFCQIFSLKFLTAHDHFPGLLLIPWHSWFGGISKEDHSNHSNFCFLIFFKILISKNFDCLPVNVVVVFGSLIFFLMA